MLLSNFIMERLNYYFTFSRPDRDDTVRLGWVKKSMLARYVSACTNA